MVQNCVWEEVVLWLFCLLDKATSTSEVVRFIQPCQILVDVAGLLHKPLGVTVYSGCECSELKAWVEAADLRILQIMPHKRSPPQLAGLQGVAAEVLLMKDKAKKATSLSSHMSKMMSPAFRAMTLHGRGPF